LSSSISPYLNFLTPKKLCKFFIDSGVDAIVCQHSHCAGSFEHYKNRPIIYGQGNFIFSDGANIYAYHSDDDDISDLYYSDLTPISIDDSTYVPNFISIMSQVPTTYPASQLSWNSFENESLMIIDNEGNYYFINDFINHTPQFESLLLDYTYWIMDDYNIVLNASDIDGDSLFFSIQNNPDWVVLENQTLYIYPEELGNFTFEVIVSDGELDEIKSITLNIVEYRPIINSVTDVPNDNGGWVYINFSKSYKS